MWDSQILGKKKKKKKNNKIVYNQDLNAYFLGFWWVGST